MAKFITTVQLRKAADKDYEKLNAEMEKAAFYLKKVHLANKQAGIRRGEYNSRKYLSVQEVADAVCKAVQKTGCDYSFTIIRAKPPYNGNG